MRPALVSYFDLGVSFGLGDLAFRPEAVTDPGIVGLVNPFGAGLSVDLTRTAPQVVSCWRAAAAAQVTRPGLGTGWAGESGITRADFDTVLDRYVTRHAIHRCQLTIYGIGTVYLCLELGPGVEEPYVRGLLSCYETAAYSAEISGLLFEVAYAHAVSAARGGRRNLVELSRRSPPLTQRDADGHAESHLFHSFTTLLLCVDEDDAVRVAGLAEAWQLAATDVVDFEYHGRLHFGWAACLLEPLHYPATAPPGYRETPDQQIVRMLRCIQIAHVFLGTCESFVQLFQDEVQQQVGAYVDDSIGGRDQEELNWLRTVALAVVNLTQFNLVAQAAEDRAYFARFAAASGIGIHQDLIREACEILHNVQVSRRQHEETRRQTLLNGVVLLLTTLTLVSVTVDGYDFIRGDRPLIAERSSRALLLAEFVLALGLLVGFVGYLSRPRRRRRRGSGGVDGRRGREEG
jgi:hypothetical protein